MSAPHEQHGTEVRDGYDVPRPLGGFYGAFIGLVLTVLVGGLVACVVLAVTRW